MRSNVLSLVCLAGLMACGSRSGLLLTDPPGVDESVPDDGPDPEDVSAFPVDVSAVPNLSDGRSSNGLDATADAADEDRVQPIDVTAIDARLDVAAIDVFSVRDATADVAASDVFLADSARDSGPDADASVDADATTDADAESDAPEDALPGIDVRAPGNDPTCTGGITRIFVISEGADSLSFQPPSASFVRIGTIACPGTTSSPNSMAVARSGWAYVAFQDGNLYRVHTTNASCLPTRFIPNQAGFSQFGMGFVRNGIGGRETLYIGAQADPSQLAWIDTTSFAVHVVGPFTSSITEPELTGTGAGQLFAFEGLSSATDSAILEIDRTTANVLAESVLTGVERGNAWAFAYWGEAFYTFTRPASSPGSVVTRFRPSDGFDRAGRVHPRGDCRSRRLDVRAVGHLLRLTPR